MIEEEDWAEIRKLINSAQRQILDDPPRYGLTWRRKPATIVDGDTPSAVRLILDGDEADMIVDAVSLTGTFAANDRVLVDVVPPSGLYVMGGTTLSTSFRYLQTIFLSDVGANTFDYSLYPNLAGVIAQISGAGGGGGGCAATAAGQAAAAGGGGGGGYSRAWFTAAQLAAAGSTTVTLGAGGTGGTAGANNGGTGGSTTFLGLITIAGSAGGEAGSAGATSATIASGVPALGTGGDINVRGGDGTEGLRQNGFMTQLGHGGACPWMGGTTRANGTDAGGAGVDAVRYGNGGSGGCNTASQATGKAGGDGSAGLCQVDIYTYA